MKISMKYVLYFKVKCPSATSSITFLKKCFTLSSIKANIIRLKGHKVEVMKHYNFFSSKTDDISSHNMKKIRHNEKN